MDLAAERRAAAQRCDEPTRRADPRARAIALRNERRYKTAEGCILPDKRRPGSVASGDGCGPRTIGTVEGRTA